MIITKTVNVSKPVYDLIKFLEELAADAIEKKPASELQQDLIAGIPLLSQLAELKPDWEKDAAAVKHAVELAGAEFIERIIAALQQKGAATPGN
jgi:hypothetical protein